MTLIGDVISQYLFYSLRTGKQKGPRNGKWLRSPVDICNTNGVSLILQMRCGIKEIGSYVSSELALSTYSLIQDGTCQELLAFFICFSFWLTSG